VGFYTYNPTVKDASTWPFNQDQFLLLNVAMGGIAGDVASSFTEERMLVDYVRVYQEEKTTKVANSNLFTNISIYPNPTKRILNISSDIPVESVVVFDLYGKIVLREEVNTFQIDLNDITKGTYFVAFYTGESKVVKRLVVN
jgi:beta-glucanase (GH16 family)